MKVNSTFPQNGAPNLVNNVLVLNEKKCDCVKCLWSDLVQCFQNSLLLPTLTPQTVTFEISVSASNDFIFLNNEVLSNSTNIKLYVYKSKEKKLININNLVAEIGKVRRIEK